MSAGDVSYWCSSSSPYCSFGQSRWNADVVYVFRFTMAPTILRNTRDALAIVKAYGRVLTGTFRAPNHEVRGILFKAFDRASTQQWINGFPSQVELVITVPESETVIGTTIFMPPIVVATKMNEYLAAAGLSPGIAQAEYLQIIPDAAANYWRVMAPLWSRKLAKECQASSPPSCSQDDAGLTNAWGRGEGVHFGSASPASAVTGHMQPTPQPELGPPGGLLSLPGMFGIGKTGVSTPLLAAGLIGGAALLYYFYGVKR